MDNLKVVQRLRAWETDTGSFFILLPPYRPKLARSPPEVRAAEGLHSLLNVDGIFWNHSII
jgi:hypothetical protein